MARLSKTRVRLATSVTIRAISGEINIDALGDADAIRALSESSVKVGAIESFSEDTPRPSEPRYELDADTSGEIVERVPQLVDRNLTINRAILYERGDILEAFGFTDITDIADQNVPFVIMKVEKAPEGSSATDRTTIYEGCYFHNEPKTYDIGGNLKVMQDVPIGYTRKRISK